MPAWAYPVAPPAPGGGAAQPAAAAPAPAADEKLTVPGSSASFTRAEIRDGFNVADWRPDLHGPMPEIVANGRRPDVRGCAFCHYPNGQGRPENGPVAGLPAAYIIQQMADFKSGARMSSEPRMGPPNAMIALAKAATDEEVRISAEYFASLRFRPWIRVVEAATVPKSTIVGGMFVPAPGGGTEPIGQRILEMPEDFARTEIRDPGTGFVAYVPPGSIAKGEALVTTGGGKTIACGVCHGETLRGLGPVPAIAGRSPSYLTRQMFDIQNGTRGGPWADLMDAVVADLTADDMVAIAAYVSSREP
jgi:cytochrome c553